MKLITHMLAAIIGCVFTTESAFADAFADFRTEVQRKSPAAWICSEIRTVEGQTLFDIRSTKNRYSIVITAHELISQQEWTLRKKRMEETIDSFIAEKAPANKHEASDALLKGMNLPDGWFGKTAVSVSLSDPELHYPEIEADGNEAESVVKAILGILKLYDKGVLADAAKPEPEKNKTDPKLRPQSK